MELSNVDAIYREYPFVQKFLPRTIVEIATVSRWDKDFLKQRNVLVSDLTYEEHCPYPSPKTKYGFYLLDGDGETVTRVGGDTGWWNTFFCKVTKENVGQALYRIGDEARRVRYAVLYHGKELCLYKLPKDSKNAEEWFHAVIGEDCEALHQV